jgi:hypothetical protein
MCISAHPSLLLPFVFLVAGHGRAADTGSDEELAIATDILDKSNAAWIASDVEAIVALFTKGGVYSEPNRTLQGQDSILAYAEWAAQRVTYAQRLGEGNRTETATFIFPIRVKTRDDMIEGEVEIELDGNLASRIEWLSWTVENW